MAATIACLGPFSEAQVRELAGGAGVKVLLVPEPPVPQQVIREAVAEADVVIADSRHKHPLDRATLATMTRCRVIVQPAAGFDTIDHLAAAELGIPVANAGGFNRDAVADWVLMGMLDVLGRGAERDRAMRAGGWRGDLPLRRELGSLTVGIVGMGNVGQAVCQRVRAFGARVRYSDVVERDVPGADPVPFTELLARSDVVTLHVPLGPQTRGLLGAAELRRMRPGAILVNASRGPVVDEAALVEALRSGRLAGAALDVFEVEPLPEDAPLRRLDNVFLSPHVAGGTVEARERAWESAAANVRRALAGEPPLNVVNGVDRAAVLR